MFSVVNQPSGIPPQSLIYHRRRLSSRQLGSNPGVTGAWSHAVAMTYQSRSAPGVNPPILRPISSKQSCSARAAGVRSPGEGGKDWPLLKNSWPNTPPLPAPGYRVWGGQKGKVAKDADLFISIIGSPKEHATSVPRVSPPAMYHCWFGTICEEQRVLHFPFIRVILAFIPYFIIF